MSLFRTRDGSFWTMTTIPSWNVKCRFGQEVLLHTTYRNTQTSQLITATLKSTTFSSRHLIRMSSLVATASPWKTTQIAASPQRQESTLSGRAPSLPKISSATSGKRRSSSSTTPRKNSCRSSSLRKIGRSEPSLEWPGRANGSGT